MSKKFANKEEYNKYNRDHYRVNSKRGKANTHVCDCGVQAAEWAHLHETDPIDPDNYKAMCRPCHQRYDNRWNEAERQAVRVAMTRIAAERPDDYGARITAGKLRASARKRGDLV